METKKRLKFRDDGTFTIVQFADVHNGGGTPEDVRSLALMEEVVRLEKPDLVVYTGDQIRSRGPDPRAQFRQVTAVAELAGVPYAFVFGNHDSRRGVTRQELMEMEAGRPLCMAEEGPEHVSGTGNYTLTVLESDAAADRRRITAMEAEAGVGNGDNQTPIQTLAHSDARYSASDNFRHAAANLYFFDSECNAPERAVRNGRSEWISRDKAGWFAAESEALEKRYGTKLPALAFFHIPLPEYEEVWNTRPCYGHRFAEVRCPQLNTGVFAAMVERGDVMGTFVGHDHSNDYWGELAGIRLCYGRTTGFNGSVQEGHSRGARIIRLHEGRSGFDSWLRLEDGSAVISQPEHLPGEPAMAPNAT